MPDRSYRPFLIAGLSLIICGAGQIYLRKFLKAFVLILSFCFAVLIIWIAISNTEFRIIKIYGREIMFSPAMKSLPFGLKSIKVTDIMKFTGAAQLAFTWIYSIADAWIEARKSSAK